MFPWMSPSDSGRGRGSGSVCSIGADREQPAGGRSHSSGSSMVVSMQVETGDGAGVERGRTRRPGAGDQLIRWIYARPSLFPMVTDLLAWPAGIFTGAFLKLVLNAGQAIDEVAVAVMVAILVHGMLGWATGLYRRRWRISSFDEISTLGVVWSGTSAVMVLGSFSARLNGSDLPTSAVITGCLTSLGLLCLERIVWRRYWEAHHRPDPQRCRPTIVLGAGEGGAQILKAMLSDPTSLYYPVALLDDDPGKRNRQLHGVRVLGTQEDLEVVAAQTGAEVLLIAITQADSSLIQTMAMRAADVGLELRVLPPASELVGRMTLADVRPPTVDDLLGRDPVEIDLQAVAGYITGRRVLVTGAGGSIGSELSMQLNGFRPSQLYLLDRDENALHAVQLAMEGHALLDSEMLIVADIRDRERMFEIFELYRPEVVFHAAALKHLTLLQRHAMEGLKTNTVGTKNLLDAAVLVGVETFVNVSTDKAADPSSVLGATKLSAERLTALAAAETGRRYVSVRFGNVLGSRGSVLPTFLGQLEAGQPITVTDPEATRFFMTIPEAVRLVVQAGAIGEPGEVMVLDMGNPVKIVDLAKQLIASLRPGTPIVFTGLRPGEKLHEVLFSPDEIGVSRQHPRIVHTPVSLCDPCPQLAEATGADENEVRAMISAGAQLRLVKSSGGSWA